MELYNLNTGQADAIVTITEEGDILLTDADKDEVIDEIETVLADRTIERTEDGDIPLIFATTHIHQDHIKGLQKLGQNDYEISHAIQPDDSRFEIIGDDADESEPGISEDNIRDYQQDLVNLSVESITQVSCSDRVPLDSDAALAVLAPPDADGSVDVTRPETGANVNFRAKQPNENGAVYKLESERSALFMGDVQDDSHHHAESWLMQQHDNPENDVSIDADILLAGHHGSGHATSKEFLDRVDPETVIMSSGLNNTYTSENEHDGHPHDATLKRLHDHDVAVYWTAAHGTTRTDLDKTLFTEQTTDLDTTDAADLAALKYYCREHDVSPEHIQALTPDHLPEETPEWVADAAPMLVETTEEIVDEALANAETVEDVRQTLAPTPDAHDQLRETVQADREEHVTTKADVKRNRNEYFSAKQKERDYRQLPLYTRVRANLPTRFGGVEHPLDDVPSPDEIDGHRKVEEVPQAVQHQPAAEQRATGDIVIDQRILGAEDVADEAVDAAPTSKTLCHRLRNTAGAHQDSLYAIETPDAHETNKPEKDLSDPLEQTNEKQTERTTEQTRSPDQDFSLGL